MRKLEDQKMEDHEVAVVPVVGDVLAVLPCQLSGSRVYFVQVSRISRTGQLTCRQRETETAENHSSFAEHSSRNIPGTAMDRSIILRPTRGRDADARYYTTNDPQFGTQTCLVTRYDPEQSYWNTSYY